MKDKILASPTLCSIPWTSYTNNPGGNGKIKVCCIQNEPPDGIYDIGNVNDKTFDEVINHKVFCDVRKSIINGEFHPLCARCKTVEQYGGRSIRSSLGGGYLQHPKFLDSIEHTDEDGRIEEGHSYMLYWDLRFSNTCNFGCRMCSPINSSFITIERDGHTKNVVKYDQERVLEFIKQNGQNCLKYNFAGGEPMLMKEHWDVLDYLIETNKTDVQLKYSLNCSTLSYAGKNVLDYWKKFNDVHVLCSIDDIGDRAEYLRYGTKWPEVFANLKTINEFFGEIWIAVTVTVYNIFYLDELVEFVNNNFKNATVTFNIAYFPHQVNVFILPQEMKEICRTKLLATVEKYKRGEFKNIKNIHKLEVAAGAPFDESLIRNRNTQNSGLPNLYLTNRATMIKDIKTLDVKRNQRFEITYPEIAQFVNNVRFLTDWTY